VVEIEAEIDPEIEAQIEPEIEVQYDEPNRNEPPIPVVAR